MDSFVKPNSITVGYNRSGQQFFDLLINYLPYIHSYFFSLTRGMRGENYSLKEVMTELSVCDTYSIPGNLLLNDKESHERASELIKLAYKICDLKAVTVISPWVVLQLKEEFPDLEIHLSVRYWDWNLDIETSIEKFKNDIKLFHKYIDVINISGAYMYNNHEMFDLIKQYGIKTKFIVNEGCIINRSNNFRNFDETKNADCKIGACSRICDTISKLYPWMELARINIFKESLQYFDYDILKLSSRSLSNELIKGLLDYWTDPSPTNYIYLGNDRHHIDISKKYDVFLNWIEAKSVCVGDCWDCKRCMKFYKDLTLEISE